MLSKVKDKRRKTGNFRHPLPEILFLVFSAVLCGYDEWELIELYGINQIEWLRLYFPYAHGTPSHDTMERLFASIEIKEFEKLLEETFLLLTQETNTSLVAIDGKRIRGSYDTNTNKPALHMVSAFATQSGLVMGQERTKDKSNEITAIPILIQTLNLEGALVSIDAMGCQREIATKILDKKADYLLAIKKNQESLYDEIEQAFISQEPIDINVNNSFGHGRVETRTCKIVKDLKFVDEAIHWKGIKTIIKIESERYMKSNGKTERETRYYISSKDASALQFNDYVRGHWAIENNLHWMLDVVFGEDFKRKRKGNSAHNMNTLYKIVLPILKQNPIKHSIKRKRALASMNPLFRDELLNF